MSSSDDEVEFDGGDVQQAETAAATTLISIPTSGPVSIPTSGPVAANAAEAMESGSISSGGSKAKNGKKPKAKKAKTSSKKATTTTKKQPKTTNKKPPPKKKGTAAPKKAAASSKSKAKPPGDNSSLDMFTKHHREFERGLTRLEKIDQFGFFLDPAPSEYDEQYDDNNATDWPDHPPVNWAMVRRRHDRGRYILDVQERDEERLQQIARYLALEEKQQEGGDALEESADAAPNNTLPDSICVLHGKGVNWDLFRKDVFGMCDFAIERNPDDIGDGKPGSLLWSVKKIKGVLDQIYDRTGYRHIHDMYMANDRHQFNAALEGATNTEAAFQGKWRQVPFPERKYERLDKNVVCAGLSDLDERIASYELRTSLPDSFVGVSYTYKDDTKSEAWMKSVLSEGQSQEAAKALAQDDGVIRAQVTTCMEMMLVAVQDRVMTEADVLHQPELRSSNWEQSKIETNPQPQEQQPTNYQSSNNDNNNLEVTSSKTTGDAPLDSTPEIVEQPVWGIDCYTRRNVMTCLATEFDHETSLVFIEKWLLPAINACPVDLAHDIANAALILEGLPFAARSNLYYDAGTQNNDESIAATEQRWSHSLIGKSLKNKIATKGPPWLQLAARLVRRARESMGADFFRIHPKGHGSIVLSPAIPPNTLVTQYRGEVYPSWRWGEKMDAIDITQERKQLKPALPDFYNMALERPQKDPRKYGLLFVDASRKAGHGSSVSHSCAPTCEVRVAAVNGKLSLVMTTLRSIEMGEELTFDYNAVTESLVEYRQAICLCGFGKCRGSFLHFATADCYQEVLKRNAPIAVRFANLAKGCMKEVMSEDDERTLRNHGFKTAAFGAISVNRHKVNGLLAADNAELDSMDNVPVWLRTYVADTLRYIEYERRALPISLICEDISKHKGGNSQGNKDESTSEDDNDKPVKGSKPMPTFFFYSKANNSRFRAILKEEEGLDEKDLPGLEFSRAMKRIAGTQWKLLNAEEKAKWKKKAEKAWEKQGGRKKAELEKKRKLGVSNDSKSKPAKKRKKEESLEEKLESSNISFREADAEGYSAMEQRIQQLTQSLSRVGRVLDRHREAFNDSGTEVSSETLRCQVHAPLAVATDEQIVSWMWNDADGIVRTLLLKAENEDCVSPSLKADFRDIMKKYEALDQFGDHSSMPADPKSLTIKPRKARRKLRFALMEFRRAIMKDLKVMAKDLKKEKGREKAERKKRLEEEKKAKLEAAKAKEEGGEKAEAEATETSVPSLASPERHEKENHHDGPRASGGCSDFESSSVATPSLLCEETKATNDVDMTGDAVKISAGAADVQLEEDVESEVATVMRQLVDSVVLRAEDEAKKARIEEEQKPKPWLKHYNQRFKLQAAADLLLMYATTSTFFLLQPYSPLKSSKIEVYARELGNAVPRSVIDRSLSNNESEVSDSQPAIEEATETPSKGKTTRRKAVTSNVANASSVDLCEPDDVVAEVTVKYQGDFVLSQLLQWYNGGIGQSPGLPNETLGCIRLPSMAGPWEQKEKIDARAKFDRPTVYESKIRRSMIAWFSNPHQRGSPWPDNITAAFSHNGSENLPKDTSSKWIPLGSPILDLLVTGDDTNIRSVLDEFGADESKAASNGLLSTLDEGRPAQAVSNWVQCESCDKWRRIPWHVDIDVLAKKFVCSDNKWNKASRSCDAPEDKYEEDDNEVVAGEGVVASDGLGPAAVSIGADPKKSNGVLESDKSDTDDRPVQKEPTTQIPENIFVEGARFDVQRQGKSKYCVGVVVEVDSTSDPKRVKFHFAKLNNKYDEFIEIGSPRIAPLHTKTKPPEKRKSLEANDDEKRAQISQSSELQASDSASELLESEKKLLPTETSEPPKDVYPKLKRLKKRKEKKRKAEDISSTAVGDDGATLENQHWPQKPVRQEACPDAQQSAPVVQPPLPAGDADFENADFENAVAGLASLRIPKKPRLATQSTSPPASKSGEGGLWSIPKKQPPPTSKSGERGLLSIPKKPRTSPPTSKSGEGGLLTARLEAPMKNKSGDPIPRKQRDAAHSSSPQSRRGESIPRKHRDAVRSSSPQRSKSSGVQVGLLLNGRFESPQKVKSLEGVTRKQRDSPHASSPSRIKSGEGIPRKQHGSSRSSSPQRQRSKSGERGMSKRSHSSASAKARGSDASVQEKADCKTQSKESTEPTAAESQAAQQQGLPRLPKQRGYQNVQTSIPQRESQEQQRQLLQQAQQLLQMQQQQPQLVHSFAAMDNVNQLQRMQQIQAAINVEIQRQQIQHVQHAIQAELHRQQIPQIVSAFAAMASSSSGGGQAAAAAAEAAPSSEHDSRRHHRSSRSERDSHHHHRSSRSERDSYHSHSSERDSYHSHSHHRDHHHRDYRYDSRYRHRDDYHRDYDRYDYRDYRDNRDHRDYSRRGDY